MPEVFNTDGKPRDAIDAVRSKYWTSTDSARALCYGGKFASEVWARKLGLGEPFEGNERTYWGNRLEHHVAEEAVRRIADKHPGADLKLERNYGIYEHPSEPWLSSSYDYDLIWDGRLGAIECKTTDKRNLQDWRDGVPEYPYIQVTHEQACRPELEFTVVACLVFEPEFHWHEMTPNFEAQSHLIENARALWECVIKETPPSVMSLETLKRVYPVDNSETIELPRAIRDVASQYLAVSDAYSELEKKKAELEAEIKSAMGSAAVGLVEGYKANWKNVTRRDLDKKALKEAHPEIADEFTRESVYRRFSIKKVEEVA